MKSYLYSEFFWDVFSLIRTEQAPYSVQLREFTDQYNSECGHFLRSTDEQVLKHFLMFRNSVIIRKSDFFH